ncbi:hypothetical protein FJ948_20825 [Mesorhizobium sp. B2-3-12]|nr:hypothetical protein FJ948_20825 [Mesorhizobium sp. B2-3-12]
MIRAVGKKQKPITEPVADRGITTEADYYARKFGLTREEAQRILDEASRGPSSDRKKARHRRGLGSEQVWSDKRSTTGGRVGCEPTDDLLRTDHFPLATSLARSPISRRSSAISSTARLATSMKRYPTCRCFSASTRWAMASKV